MIFAHEDILNQRPIAWFPGMAGTENKESPKMECTEKGKSAWDRYESQASTAVPGDETYQRLISTDSKIEEDKIRPEEALSEKAKAVLHQEEYDDESSMLERGFGFGLSSMNGGIAIAMVLLATLCALNSSSKSFCFQGIWMILVVGSLLVLGALPHQQQGVTRAEASSYKCEGEN